jgi:polyvinyl alcohol dehydrogenase (cytochrome)
MMAKLCKIAVVMLPGILGLMMTLSNVAHASQDQTSATRDGEALYGQRCASCHDTGVPRAPNRAALGHMSADNIRLALTTGKMSEQGASLTPAQIDAISRFLTQQSGVKEPPSAIDTGCPNGGANTFADPFNRPHWNGWGVGPTQSRSQPAKMAGLQADQVPKLKLKWAFGFPGVGQAYGQPTIAGGRIFVGSAARKVYSLSADSGCTYWVFDTEAPVRTAISVGSVGSRWAVYFGDQRANAYAVDAVTGKLLWKTHLDEHPGAIVTGAPTLAGGKLYVPLSSYEEVLGASPTYQCCKFRGSVSALDAVTGKVLWKSYTVPEEPKPVRKNKGGVQLWGPSGAAVWSSPTVDLKKHMVYVATGDSYSDPPASTSDAFIAFDSETGKMAWARQMTAGDAFTVDCDMPLAMRGNCPEANGPDFDFGSSPILVELPKGHRALIAGQKSGVVWAVDPDQDGKILWQRRVGKGGRLGGVQWGSAVDAKNVYVALSDVNILGAAPGKAGAQKTAMGPLMLDPKAGGGMFALNLETGEVVWQTPHPPCGDRPGCSPAQSAAVTLIPGVVFSGGLDGSLRAYSTKDGRIIWEVDTEHDYTTVNGVKANGGSLDGPGPVIVGGMLYLNSGYQFLGGAPGNVLLAFSVDGK